jgi:hypothetical protein
MQNTRSWNISIEVPYLVLLALYIRDALRLHPHVTPLLPPLEPSVDVLDISTSEQEERGYVTQQWEVWWQHLLACSSSKELERAIPNGTTFWGASQATELQASFQRCASKARSWTQTRKQEIAVMLKQSARRHIEIEVVQEIFQEHGESHEFDEVEIWIIPCTDKDIWSVTPTRAFMSETFYLDPITYREWLKHTIVSLI